MSTRQGILRFLGYALAIAGITWLVVWSAENSADGLGLLRPVPGSRITTTEFSLLESIQHALLLFCLLIFAWIAMRDRLRRPLAIAFAGAFAVCLVRELDFFFDRYVLDNLWPVFAALTTVVVGVYSFRHRRRVEAGWQRSWPSAGLAMVIAGLILLVVFTQLLARRSVWVPTLGDDYVRSALLGFEELSELGAYLVIAIGSIEFLYTWSRLPETRSMDRPSRKRRV